MDLTLDEAKDVLNNSQNAHHEAFHKNLNPEVVAAVNKAFEVAYPGERTLGDFSDPQLDLAMEKAVADSKV